jgi:hypothetical protein
LALVIPVIAKPLRRSSSHFFATSLTVSKEITWLTVETTNGLAFHSTVYVRRVASAVGKGVAIASVGKMSFVFMPGGVGVDTASVDTFGVDFGVDTAKAAGGASAAGGIGIPTATAAAGGIPTATEAAGGIPTATAAAGGIPAFTFKWITPP